MWLTMEHDCFLLLLLLLLPRFWISGNRFRQRIPLLRSTHNESLPKAFRARGCYDRYYWLITTLSRCSSYKLVSETARNSGNKLQNLWIVGESLWVWGGIWRLGETKFWCVSNYGATRLNLVIYVTWFSSCVEDMKNERFTALFLWSKYAMITETLWLWVKLTFVHVLYYDCIIHMV